MASSLPKCWIREGECLDLNEPPLKMDTRTKPQLNRNVIAAVKNVPNIDMCMSKCEEQDGCNYFTLYKENLAKNCHLVGFNLGTECKRLGNVCVLQRGCFMFNESCGGDCLTARRSAKWDKRHDAKTLVLGGVRKPRLRLDEYATRVEVHDDLGQLDCAKSPTTLSREGAAAGFFQPSDPAGPAERVLLCGGWHTNNISASNRFTGVLDGQYEKSCESMLREGNWEKDSTIQLVTPRAFFPIVETPFGLYAIGGYNEDAGMLRSIERFDGTAWTAVSEVALVEPKSHTCGVFVPLNNASLIFVIGGWDANLDYVDVVEVFEVSNDGSLTRVDHEFSLPSERDDDPKFAGKADLQCQHFRRGGWRDGILISGGYRSAGAWLNTAWFLDLKEFEVAPLHYEALTAGRHNEIKEAELKAMLKEENSNATTISSSTRWATRLTDISRQFVDGRHFHQGMVAGLRPMLLGGWSNRALDSKLQFDDCSVNEEDPTRLGVWKEYSRAMAIGREKFSTVTVPADYLVASDIRC